MRLIQLPDEAALLLSIGPAQAQAFLPPYSLTTHHKETNTMTPRTLCLASFLLVATALFLAPHASATSVTGCVQIQHKALTQSNYYRISATGNAIASDACTSQAPATLRAGDCITLYTDYLHQTSGPAESQLIWIYFFRGTTENDHGSNGASHWSQQDDPHATEAPGAYPAYPASLKFFNSAGFTNSNFQWCSTTDGTTAGTPIADSWRMVLRVCTNGASGCNNGAGDLYDINTDTNPTCTCHGDPGTGNTVASFIQGVLTSIVVPPLDDPLTAWAPNIKANTVQNITIHSVYDNGTARTGAATNLTLYVIAPDNTLAVNAANPTEVTTTGATIGNYYYTFTPTQVGIYKIVVKQVTSLAEVRSSSPSGFLTMTHDPDDLYGLMQSLFTGVNLTATTTQVNSGWNWTSYSVNQTVSVNSNWTSYSVNTTANTDTAPLATLTALSDAHNEIDTNVNTSRGTGANWTASLLNTTASANANWTSYSTNQTVDSDTLPLARTTHLSNTNSYLAGLVNSTTSANANWTTSQLNATISANANWTTSQENATMLTDTTPLATTTHIANTNSYLAGIANATTAPLATGAAVSDLHNEVDTNVNTSRGIGANWTTSQLNTTISTTANWTSYSANQTVDSDTLPLARATHLSNTNSYLAGIVNATSSANANWTSYSVNQTVSVNANWTTSQENATMLTDTAPLATTTHLGNANAYLASLANATTAPLATGSQLSDAHNEVDTLVNTSRGIGANWTASLLNTTASANANWTSYSANQTVDTDTLPLARTTHLSNENSYLASLANSTTSPLATTSQLNAAVAPLATGAALGDLHNEVDTNVNTSRGIGANWTTSQLNATISANANWTTSQENATMLTDTTPLATTTHVANTNSYLAGIANATTAPLATTAQLNSAVSTIDANTNLDTSGLATKQDLSDVHHEVDDNVNLTAVPLAKEISVQYFGQSIFQVVNNTQANVTNASNYASGALTQAFFIGWRDGESRVTSAIGNATRSDLSTARGELASAHREDVAGLTTVAGILHADGNATRAFMPTKWVVDSWGTVHPRTRDATIAFVGGLAFVSASVLPSRWARGKSGLGKRANMLFAGIALLAAFAWANGLAG